MFLSVRSFRVTPFVNLVKILKSILKKNMDRRKVWVDASRAARCGVEEGGEELKNEERAIMIGERQLRPRKKRESPRTKTSGIKTLVCNIKKKKSPKKHMSPSLRRGTRRSISSPLLLQELKSKKRLAKLHRNCIITMFAVKLILVLLSPVFL